MNRTYLKITDPRFNNEWRWIAYYEIVDDFGYMWSYDRKEQLFWSNQSLQMDYEGRSNREMTPELDYAEVSYEDFIELTKVAPIIGEFTRRNLIRKQRPCIPASEVFSVQPLVVTTA